MLRPGAPNPSHLPHTPLSSACCLEPSVSLSSTVPLNRRVGAGVGREDVPPFLHPFHFPIPFSFLACSTLDVVKSSTQNFRATSAQHALKDPVAQVTEGLCLCPNPTHLPELAALLSALLCLLSTEDVPHLSLWSPQLPVDNSQPPCSAHLILIQHEQLVPRDDAEPWVPTRTIIRGVNVLGSVHRGSPYIWETKTQKQ